MSIRSELSVSAEAAAKRLLGCDLVRAVKGQEVVARIVETEAYDQNDAASHSFNGKTPRTEVMFGPAGFLYVYFTYGMHFCCNVVTGAVGEGSAVLIRAVEPIAGEDVMSGSRKGRHGIELSNGPAKLCQALQINKDLNGEDLTKGRLQLRLNEPLPEESIFQTTRIGISRAQDVPWRFYIADNPYVSKK